MARILLADDDKGSLDLVRRTLEVEGHTVVAVDDGAEALAQLGDSSFDLLVADIQMPGLDGIELAKRALVADSRIRLVLMSAYLDGLEKARGLGGGRARLVGKPFTLDQIRSEVRAALV